MSTVLRAFECCFFARLSPTNGLEVRLGGGAEAAPPNGARTWLNSIAGCGLSTKQCFKNGIVYEMCDM